MDGGGEIEFLRRTFLHIAGIGERRERRLWAAGVRTWDEIERCPLPVGIPRSLPDEIAASRAALRCRDVGFFAQRLPPREHWRLYPTFRDRTAFLDIETTGLLPGGQAVTVVGISNGTDVWSFVQGRNLEELPDVLAQVDILVTFNGACFDLPFLKVAFPGLPLPPAHIDLRFLYRRLGMRGGLKAVEAAAGLQRPVHLEGMDGYEAVLLWRAYLDRGDEGALTHLVEYNREDVVNLKPLLETACEMLAGRIEREAEVAGWLVS